MNYGWAGIYIYISDNLLYHLKHALPTPELRSNMTEFSLEKLYSYRKVSNAGYSLYNFFKDFVHEFLCSVAELVSISLFLALS